MTYIDMNLRANLNILMNLQTFAENNIINNIFKIYTPGTPE